MHPKAICDGFLNNRRYGYFQSRVRRDLDSRHKHAGMTCGGETLEVKLSGDNYVNCRVTAGEPVNDCGLQLVSCVPSHIHGGSCIPPLLHLRIAERLGHPRPQGSLPFLPRYLFSLDGGCGYEEELLYLLAECIEFDGLEQIALRPE